MSIEKIQVMGSGCRKCHELLGATEVAVRELGLTASVDYVTDLAQIAAAGVMRTPALVADGRVLSAGRVPTAAELREILAEAEGLR